MGKKYLILGATGTLGHETINQLLSLDDTEIIRCVSRDELKLSELRLKFLSHNQKIQTYIGDIRDKHSISPFFKDIDVVFHFAALKRIPELESQPIESLKTNVYGTINSAECALENNIKYFIFSSTDKACRPINTYGACKFLSEQIIFNLNSLEKTNFSVYRWVNVLASRGAVTYAFKDAIENNRPAFITDERMTRGWIFIEDAVKFILKTYEEKSNEIKIPKFKCSKVLEMLSAIGTIMNKVPAYVITGFRPGEKLAEDILYNKLTGECISTDNHDFYSKEELLDIAKIIVGVK